MVTARKPCFVYLDYTNHRLDVSFDVFVSIRLANKPNSIQSGLRRVKLQWPTSTELAVFGTVSPGG